MILALGSNGRGQLGLGDDQDRAVPEQVSLIPRHSQIRAEGPDIISGGNHTLLLQNGELFAAGLLPTGDQTFFFSNALFERIPLPGGKRVKMCAATWESITAVTEEDEVYSVGVGRRGQLGLGLDCTETSVFQRITAFPPPGSFICDISGSMGHVAVVLSTGEVFGWGTGRKGQLGAPLEDLWEPRKIEQVPFPVELARCGKDFTVVASRIANRLLVFGDDRWGIVSTAPKIVPPWTQISAGWSSAFLLGVDGKIVSWGRNHHGQLAPNNLPLIKKIGVGSEHVLALSFNGEVISWGWGEHGNCGTNLDESGNVKGHWNVLDDSGNAKSVGAGCATSWIIIDV